MTDRQITVLLIGATGLTALIGSVFLFARLLNEATGADPMDAATLAVLVAAFGALTTLAGTCVGLLAPSPLSKTTTAPDEPVAVVGPGGGPVPVIADDI